MIEELNQLFALVRLDENALGLLVQIVQRENRFRVELLEEFGFKARMRFAEVVEIRDQVLYNSGKLCRIDVFRRVLLEAALSASAAKGNPLASRSIVEDRCPRKTL